MSYPWSACGTSRVPGQRASLPQALCVSQALRVEHRLGDDRVLVLAPRREVKRRVVQDLHGDRGPTLLQRLACRRREPAARALAPDGQPVAVPAVLRAVLCDPPDDLEGLVGRCGKPVLRRDHVVDVDDGDTGLCGQAPTQRVVELQPPHDVPAPWKLTWTGGRGSWLAGGETWARAVAIYVGIM